MARILEGSYIGKGKRISIVVSRFNEYVTRVLLEGALNELRRLEVLETDLNVVWVPGAYEIPVACLNLFEAHQPDGIVALGCVIQGQTSHYDQVVESLSQGIQSVTLKTNRPIGFGVLTVNTLDQAIDRAGGKLGNKGRDAARATLEMVTLLQSLKQDMLKTKALDAFVKSESISAL